MGNIFTKVASDTLGLSDIGKIIAPEDFDKVAGDDYIFHEDDKHIYFVIQSKTDEYVFTNYGLLHVDGDSAISNKRTIHRFEYCHYPISHVTLETAGTVDLVVELKWHMNDYEFSVDVDKKQIEELKDLYKALYEIGRIQLSLNYQYQDDLKALDNANEVFNKSRFNVENPASMLQEMTRFNQEYLTTARHALHRRDFGTVFEKYINN